MKASPTCQQPGDPVGPRPGFPQSGPVGLPTWQQTKGHRGRCAMGQAALVVPEML